MPLPQSIRTMRPLRGFRKDRARTLVGAESWSTDLDHFSRCPRRPCRCVNRPTCWDIPTAGRCSRSGHVLSWS